MFLSVPFLQSGPGPLHQALPMQPLLPTSWAVFELARAVCQAGPGNSQMHKRPLVSSRTRPRGAPWRGPGGSRDTQKRNTCVLGEVKAWDGDLGWGWDLSSEGHQFPGHTLPVFLTYKVLHCL